MIDYSDKIGHWAPRKGPINKIVIHNTDSTAKQAIDWFANSKSKVSSHYVIDRSGNILRCVLDENVAWHSGVKEVNESSIGIELEASKSLVGMTDKQDHILYNLLVELMQKYHIMAGNISIHRMWKATDCPKWIFPTDEEFKLWIKNHLM
jgi:N-acetyl-anhydromuramyl-L-alanine amidase AmpD